MCVHKRVCACVCAWPSGHAGPVLANRMDADEEGAGGSLGLLPEPTFTALAARDGAEKGQEVPAPGRSWPLPL